MKITQTAPASKPSVWWMVALLAGILGFLFRQSFVPGFVHFSNDGPLGAQNTAFLQLPAGFTGLWDDINAFGYNSGSFSPSLTAFLSWLLGPVGFSKFLAPIALFILGISAWFFFRQLRFTQLAATIGALATALNSAFLSTACWGVASQQVAVGMEFLAMGLIVSNTPETPRLTRWARLALAGLAVGMGVMEGADNGALFSVFVAAFAIWYSLTGEGALGKRLSRGVARVAVIAVFAGLIAAQTIISLVGSAIVGVGGSKTQAQQMGYDWATVWSLPKAEALGYVIPGLFGYRMDTGNGGHYWGRVGSDPAWDKYLASDKKAPPPQGNLRFTGGNPYLGVVVAVVALWAVVQSLRKQDSAFTLRERKLIWFWTIVGAVCMLLAFGRFAPFYKLFYALPGSSYIRNPVKFIAIFSFSMVVVFAYGVNGLRRKYMGPAAVSTQGWWKRASTFDKRWVMASLFVVVASLMAWWGYHMMQPKLEDYLVELQRLEAMSRNINFNPDGAHDMARQQAGFSVRQVGWFVLFLSLSASLIGLTLRGTFTAERARIGGILLGVLVAGDLCQAARYWILHWDYKEKYDIDAANPGHSINPLIERLRQKPYESRTVILPGWYPYLIARHFPQAFRVTQELVGQEQFLDQLYKLAWAQHHFPYYNIQSLDVIQMPRPPADLATFEEALHLDFANPAATLPLVVRRWELTNTRYVLGAAAWLDSLNGALDPGRNRFRIAERFSLALKPGVTEFHNRLEELTTEPNVNGNYALFEFTGALPRVQLYSNWQRPADDPAAVNELKTTITTNDLEFLSQVGTNDFLTLRKLASPSFDPHQTVLVADSLPAPAATNQNAGTVEFSSYAPKKIVLKADAKVPSVLLLNDKFEPKSNRFQPIWKVTVDGKAETVLRCNFAMRGVFLPPGVHTVEFRFEAPRGPLYVSLTGLLVAVALIGFLFAVREKNATEQPPAKG